MSAQNADAAEAKHMQQAHAYAFAELEMFIWEKQISTKECCSFKLMDSYSLYTQQLQQLNVDASSLHKTRMKEEILVCIPDKKSGLHKGKMFSLFLPLSMSFGVRYYLMQLG